MAEAWNQQPTFGLFSTYTLSTFHLTPKKQLRFWLSLTYRGPELQICALGSTGKWVVIFTGCFILNIHWTEQWLCPNQSWCFGKEKNLVSLQGIKPHFLSHPAYKLSNYTKWAIASPRHHRKWSHMKITVMIGWTPNSETRNIQNFAGGISWEATKWRWRKRLQV